jgi:hypothetical protein
MGNDVDVVWVQGLRLCYAHSADGGATFGQAMSVADLAFLEAAPRIARGPNGAVAVLWEDTDLQVRVSSDGGSSFGPASAIAVGDGHWAAVAAGDGIVYVAYLEGRDLLVRRSLDMGTSWTSPQRLDDVVYAIGYQAPPSIAAEGSNAYVAYQVVDDDNSYIRYRQTSNSGESWSRFVALSPRENLRFYSETPVITHRGGTVHVAYGRCNYWFEGRCDTGSSWLSDLVYRQSADGVSWTRAETAFVGSPSVAYEPVRPIGLTVADRVTALFTLFGDAGCQECIVTRAP